MSGMWKKEYKEKLHFASACGEDDEYTSDTTTMILIPTNMFCECSELEGRGITQENHP